MSDTIDRDSNRGQMLNWLRTASKRDLRKVITWINNNGQLHFEIKTEGLKAELLQALVSCSHMSTKTLWRAIDDVFEDEDEADITPVAVPTRAPSINFPRVPTIGRVRLEGVVVIYDERDQRRVGSREKFVTERLTDGTVINRGRKTGRRIY